MSSGESYFDVDVDDAVDPVAVTARGELDGASAETLEGAMATAHEAGRGVVLDLEAVSFIDSSGLRVIAAELQRAKETGLPFVVSAASEPVRRIFDVTGFTDLIQT